VTQAGWTDGTAPAVHQTPTPSYQWQNMSQNQLNSLRSNLIESILQIVVQLVTGGLLPGGAGTQLTSWATNIPLIGPLLALLTGSSTTGGGGLLGLGSVFTDLFSLLGGTGSSLGLGTGSPTAATSVGSIPIFGPLLNLFISLLGGSGSGLGGLTSVFTDLLSLFGGSGLTGLGSGSPSLPGIGSIPILGGLLSGGGSNILTSLIPGLDASKIITGTFGAGLLQPLIDAISGGFGGSSGLGFGGLTSWLSAIPGAQQVLDVIMNAFGISGTGHSNTNLLSMFTNVFGLLGSPTGMGTTPVLPGISSIPILGGLLSGGNILGSIIPGLDASKITTGAFPQSMITGLVTLLTGFSGGSSILTQLIGIIPGTAGGLSGLTGLGSIFTSLLGLLGSPTGLGGTTVLPGISSIPLLGGLLSGGNILGSIIPGLDTSKITTGTFADSILPGLGSLSDALFGGFTGSTVSGTNQSAVNVATATQTTTVGAQGAQIAQIIAGIGVSGGTSDSDNFERTGAVTPNWTFLATTGTGTLDGHNFHYSGTGSSAEFVMLKNNLICASDRMTSVVVTNMALPSYPLFTPFPYGTYIDVWVRCTLFTTYATRSGVRLRVYSAAPYTASWSLDNIVSGTATNLQTGSCPQVGSGASISLEAGAGGTTRRYLGLLNGSTIGCDFTDVSTTTIGAANRYRGFGGKGNSGIGPSLGTADLQQWTGT
jgi:hypothetical protein